MKIDIKSLNYEELKESIRLIGEKPFRAKQIYEWLHKKLIDDFDEMSNLSKDLREKLKDNYEIIRVEKVDQRTSKEDETSKFLFRLYDDRVIESVLMKYKHGNSVCISSQVGCRMGCKFCASTLGGLERNLTPSEMLDQIYQIQKLSNERVSNIVVMGTGEPFDNYDNLLKFIELVSDENGLNISQRNITVSTCGLVEKIRMLADEELQITLAISLHAPNDEVRKELMPVANKYDIATILDACKYYYNKTKRRLTFEYSLVEGVNDSSDNAMELVKKLKGLNCHVNLIPVNPIKERNYKHSQGKFIQNFKNILEKNRINVTIRREMGADIDAACGQLRKSYMDQNSED
ncbi:23S rRNA (adenine(2503)-C(2))-methyltransferase RlmN [Anaeromicropila herbilytica]|uniref:Probable dual-specificity RNA methyltransferase RlmN n=1 Tax=Anaeromicropila herbilytica TaxID=2785025 RepID=A0A7R7EM91_9FIRM|nr:23S rRNA (adenine(2503)-C(2))-methyltransferase RlmN [Anaeromicropila herbilytica]BCN31570.1 putative dual-specificity RNA methyltransferase RlmN [Anaeromicropila herbilytica]